MGTLARSRVYQTWSAPELTISTQDGSAVELSTDGEVVTGDPAVTLPKRHDPLQVYRPEVRGASGGGFRGDAVMSRPRRGSPR
jgi:hypothetical protein